MFGISGAEFLVIAVVIVVVVGPSRLPEVTRTLTRWVKKLRVQLTKVRASLDSEVGDDLRNMNLSALDVRQYDPRRIVREAVQEEMDEWRKLVGPFGQANASSQANAQATAHANAAASTSNQTSAPAGPSQASSAATSNQTAGSVQAAGAAAASATAVGPATGASTGAATGATSGTAGETGAVRAPLNPVAPQKRGMRVGQWYVSDRRGYGAQVARAVRAAASTKKTRRLTGQAVYRNPRPRN
ncbi:twin-arginine translocase TatA/TatE family subunit [Gleimia hominis]|uniref:twin-arginine translocase TatA/TatE family subunit n=1 Tax=Gleimia hominis TaxID=595468 RepID=UPI000C808A82|nr:twin-arginine translocase TatA/TatE family subunit [Gleimia hominis]WIK64700.1 twin-arginine translocase TatA/TatE family subunit [Gleimia hominis]